MSTVRIIATVAGALITCCVFGQGAMRSVGVKKRFTTVVYLRDSVAYGVESSVTTYDSLGRELVVRRKHIDQTISVDSSSYDTAGQLLYRATLNYKEASPARRFAGVVKYQYDSTGLLLEEILTSTEDPNGDFTAATTTYTYSDRDMPSAKTIVDETGTARRRIEYGYDSVGNVAWEKDFRDGSRLPETWREFEYDDWKRVATETHRDSSGKVLFMWTNQYSLDSLGHPLVVLQRFDDGRVRMVRESKYDSKGVLIEEVIRLGKDIHIVRHSYEYYQ